MPALGDPVVALGDPVVAPGGAVVALGGAVVAPGDPAPWEILTDMWSNSPRAPA